MGYKHYSFDEQLMTIGHVRLMKDQRVDCLKEKSTTSTDKNWTGHSVTHPLIFSLFMV